MAIYQYPAQDELLVSLARCLAPGQKRGAVEVIDRLPNVYQSSSASEVVACRVHSGEERRIFCKYGHGEEISIGHRGGTSREALVYERVLTPLQLRPCFLGSHLDPATGNTWLFLEFLGECLRMQKGRQPHAMKSAAEWIARFHRINESRIDTLDFLPRYDLAYYLSWVERTRQFAAPLAREFRWLEKLCARAPRLLAVLLERPHTIIHAEYFPQNVLLLQGEGACAVDWESAAIAPGELDLASMCVGWGTDLQALAERHYQLIRWDRLQGACFEEALGAARLYWAFRWLGEKPEWSVDPDRRLWYTELRDVGSRFGLI